MLKVIHLVVSGFALNIIFTHIFSKYASHIPTNHLVRYFLLSKLVPSYYGLLVFLSPNISTNPQICFISFSPADGRRTNYYLVHGLLNSPKFLQVQNQFNIQSTSSAR